MKNTHIKNKNITTIVNFILDKSWSMELCREGTIKGFNNYISQLKEKEGKVLLSLTFFDTSVTKKYILTPIEDVKKLTYESYVPNGYTALWDAAVETTEEAYEKSRELREEKPVVLTVIMTDGEENSSKRHDRECMNGLVKDLEKEGNWTFVYLGANQDSWSNASQVGMSQGNTANWQSSNLGMIKSMQALSVGTNNLMASANRGEAMNTVSFFAGSKDGSDFIK